MAANPQTLSPTEALALLSWQVELGADEAIGDAPIDRRRAPASAVRAAAAPVSAPQAAGTVATEAVDAVAAARVAAGGAADLDALAAALAAYPHCELTRGARSTVFADGRRGARVMIVGEAPGRDEDIAGRPFVGRAGQLLDRMFAAIGMSRDAATLQDALYITNILPWRPPQNRDPSPDEIAMMTPFLDRHIELAGPEVIVTMGRFSLQVLTGLTGITRMRGKWTQARGLPCLPMLHPAYLLRTPAAKRETWADLLELRARLREGARP